MRPTSLIILALAIATPLAAQHRRPAAVARRAIPPAPGAVMTVGEWRVRYDRPGAPDAMKIAAATPGWNFTTSSRGAAIVWRPTQSAAGNFRAEAEMYALQGAGHMEGYGLIVGGLNLGADNQSYLYFLVRGDGQFLIKHRAGAETHDIVPWTANAAVASQQSTAQTKNILALEAGRDSVVFFVNNQRVHVMARTGAPVAGILGLRINHGLNVRVMRVAVVPR